MKIVSSIADLHRLEANAAGFVPTMGAFHEGHLELMQTARRECETVIVSLFVNPTQFGKNEDFSKYPRDLDKDAKLAEGAGVDILFCPTPDEMYPRVGSTIHVPGITERWEGASRPGHFDGVATVVAKLFNIVRPQIAYFGLKDLQQCMVIERMCVDLNIPVRLSFQPTVRELDGLAMSSRNVYLTSPQRSAAPTLYRELMRASTAIKDGSDVTSELERSWHTLQDKGFAPDYFDLVSLPEMDRLDTLRGRCALIAAAKLGNTRLIDNLVF